MNQDVDLCIIGAGTAGFAAAQTARQSGLRFVLVSGIGPLGGTCIRSGCMPAKTLLSSTERLGQVQESVELGIQTNDVHVDIPAIIARKRELVEYFAEDRVHELEHYPLVRGIARFVAPDTIECDGKRIRAERFVIATGSTLRPPPITGLQRCGFLTSDDVLNLRNIPSAVAVLGGGPVGCEFAQYFARLGARVTLVQRERELLRNEDPDLAQAIAAALEADGVCVMTGVALQEVRGGDGRCVLAFGSRSECAETHVDAIVVTTQRVPNIDALDLSAGEVEVRDGAVLVDDTLRTSNPRVYGAGDVIGRRCLVHAAAAEGRAAVRNAFSATPQPLDFDRIEAHGVYTQPQLAVAGIGEQTARARGFEIRVARERFSDVGKAIVSGEPEGFIKMIAGQEGRLLGVGIVAANAIELIGEAMAWIDRSATVSDVATLPHLHPTASEIYERVAQKLASEERRPTP
ncbi:MAG: FAD-dependent oxidoreductase [Candidatus Eremiobacteraeota bacterium]|nr:FAD-dependent oxidoreductase [Candidatus Eremiobacteraeota bacterium]